MTQQNQVSPATGPWPTEETAEVFMASVLIKDEAGEIHLQTLPPQTPIERKKQMRLKQEERRRDKKQLVKASEAENDTRIKVI